MKNGYNNAILRIDLSTRKITTEHPGESFFRSYFGGWGLIAHELLASSAHQVDPFHPENPLVFAPGIVTGADVPGSGRHAVGARSPLTGGFGESDVGGFWGAELKDARFLPLANDLPAHGRDALIVLCQDDVAVVFP